MSRGTVYARVTWTIASYLVVQSAVIAVAVLPSALIVGWWWPHLPQPIWQRMVLLAAGAAPLYLIGAFALVVTSAFAARLLGWHTTPDLEMRIGDFGWPLMHWARYLMMTHAVRLFVGIPLRGSPLWGLFIRLNGGHVGHRVWINSTAVCDHNLLAFGDNTVVGADVHLSGHTVEAGVVRTARVVVGSNVTIGSQSVVGIGVEIGNNCQVGALSFVPKYSRLEAGGTYGGIPVHRLSA